MRVLGILDDGHGFAPTVCNAFFQSHCAVTLVDGRRVSRCKNGKERDVLVVFRSATDMMRSIENLDIIVIPPSSGAEISTRLPLNCRVICGGDAELCGCKAGIVVTYGMRGLDTVTCSSIHDGNAIIALQREIVTLDGTLLDMQEIPVGIIGNPSGREQNITAAAAAMLVCGELPLWV